MTVYCHWCNASVIPDPADPGFCPWCEHPLSPDPAQVPSPEVCGVGRMRIERNVARLRLVERKDTA